MYINDDTMDFKKQDRTTSKDISYGTKIRTRCENIGVTKINWLFRADVDWWEGKSVELSSAPKRLVWRKQ